MVATVHKPWGRKGRDGQWKIKEGWEKFEKKNKQKRASDITLTHGLALGTGQTVGWCWSESLFFFRKIGARGKGLPT